MKLCVQPTYFGWQAADEDSLDGEIHGDGHHTYSGQYSTGRTRKEALEGLREVYEDFLDDESKQVTRDEAIEAIAWIDARLLDEQTSRQDAAHDADKDTWFDLAKAICHGG